MTSIVVQLAHNMPSLCQHIGDAVAKPSDIVSHSLRDQWQHFVCRPLLKLQEPDPYILIVDALNECDNDDNIRIIVHLLAEIRSLNKAQLRVFLTSRPEVPIRHGFSQISSMEHKDLVSHNISPPIVDHDIRLFLEDRQSIDRERGLRAD